MTVCPPGMVLSVPQTSFNVVVTVLVIVVVCDLKVSQRLKIAHELRAGEAVPWSEPQSLLM